MGNSLEHPGPAWYPVESMATMASNGSPTPYAVVMFDLGPLAIGEG